MNPIYYNIAALGDLGEVITGKTPNTKVEEYWDGTIPFITPGDLTGGIIQSCQRSISGKGLSAVKGIPSGAVLTTCIGSTIGRAGISKFREAATNQQINALVVDPEKADNWFCLYAIIFSRKSIVEAAQKTAVPILNKSNFCNIKIPLPDLPIQQKIGRILCTLQRALEQQERLIALTAELKKALMHKFFTEGTCDEPKKETEIGPVPESWTAAKLEETGEVIYGIQAAVANNTKPIGYKILTNKNITIDGQIVLDNVNYFELKTKRHFDTILKKGDILFNWRSGSKEHIGKTAYFNLEGEFTHSSFILRIRPDNSVNGKFLFYYFHYLRESGFFLQKHEISSINATFNKNAVNSLVLYLPSVDIQSDIVTVLELIDKKRIMFNNKLNLLQTLFRTLLHQLMTAQIRLNDIDLPELKLQTETVSSTQGG